MRAALIEYFDIGRSFGLGDGVFRPECLAPPPDIGIVGVRNPLGQGVLVSLAHDAPDVISQWRAEAVAQSRRPTMELGWSPAVGLSKSRFKKTLREYLRSLSISKCELTVYAVGTVFLCVEFGQGLPVEFVEGLLKCFEFAAYQSEISAALHKAALTGVEQSLKNKPTGLEIISTRPEPPVEKDVSGYEESRLLNHFTYIVLCVDPGDEAQLPIVRRVLDLDECTELSYKYHGRLYFSWVACIAASRNLDIETTRKKRKNSINRQIVPPEQQIARILQDIQIAHTFLGTCEALESLVLNEIHKQVDSIAAEDMPRHDAAQMNKLRTLALAANTLTDFESVCATGEDQDYFRAFEQHAHVKARHRRIQERCDVLYNVQLAETQAKEMRQQTVLNMIVLILTAFTIVSVLTDSYDFIRDQESLLQGIGLRVRLLSGVVVLVVVGALGSLYSICERRRRRAVG